MTTARYVVFTCVSLAALSPFASGAEPARKETGPVSYYREVRPLLQMHCQGCHQPAKPRGDLILTSHAALLKAGASDKPAVVPGKPELSLLLEQIVPQDGKAARMPKGKDPLGAQEVLRIKQWIAEGARDDTPASAKAAVDPDHPPVYVLPPVLTAVAYSPDGSLLAVSGYHEVLLHRADGSQIVARLVGLSERIQALAFSPDGKRLAVAGGSPARFGEIQVWDVDKKKLALSVLVTHDSVYGVSWSHDGTRIAFGCADNTIRAVEADTGKQVLYQGAHNDWVLDTVFSTNSSHLISVSRDRSLKLTEVATQRFVDNITSITPGALKGGLQAVDRHPTKDEVAIGGADGAPKIYRIYRQKGKERKIGDDFNKIREFPPLPGVIYAVKFSPDGNRIVAGSSKNGQGEAAVYQTADGKLVAKLAGTHGAIYALAYRPDGKEIASAGFDGVVCLNDPDTGKLIKEFVPVPLVSSTPATVQKEERPASFVQDVMPAMAKLGCNAGTCHGAQNGKNGFKLSLRGYDPLFDHRALTDDLEGRRFNRSAPERSLMLLKPSGAVPHTGGVLIRPGEPAYEKIRSWIAGGVKLDLDSSRVTALEVSPKGPVLQLPGMKQQLSVRATYSDGSTRDVSAEAFIESSNTEVAVVDKHGLAVAVRRGESAMMARYEGAYAATTLVVMGDRTGFAWKDMPELNYIDTLVYEKLKQVKVLPSELCSDGDFIRRVTLDLTGVPPAPEDVRAFLADSRPTKVKRDELVDRLLGSPDYIEHWTNKWADLLQVNRKFLGEPGAASLRRWIREAVAANMPYDKFTATILTGADAKADNPSAAYYKVLPEPGAAMENTTQLFLAVRFNCNKCHDHPFERWTQDQYYHLAAYFAPKGEVKHERTGEMSAPSFPYSHADLPPASLPRRAQLSHWITSKENPNFARSYVNRLWSYLLGVGLIEPVDDIRAGNPPSNPKLLERLTQDFVASGFDVRHMLRTICTSRVYQHALETNKWNADDSINYSHALARRLPAEVLYDTIHRATGSSAKLPGMPAGARAAQLLDTNVAVPGNFLDLFGRPPRESACECERSGGMLLGPILTLVNGPVINDALKDPQNRIAKLVAAEKDDARVVEELYVAILCRPPAKNELAAGIQALQGTGAIDARLLEAFERRRSALADYEQQLPGKQAAWEKTLKASIPWTVLDIDKAESIGGATLVKQPDQSILAGGKNSTPEVYTLSANTDIQGITGVRLEVLTDASLPAQGPGRAASGNFVLNEFRLSAGLEGDLPKARPVDLRNASAAFSQQGFAVAQAIDNNPATGWAVAPELGKTHVALFELKTPLTLPGPATLMFTLEQRFASKLHNIGKLRLAVTTAKPPLRLNPIPEPIARVLAVPAEQRSPEQKAELLKYYRPLDAELARLERDLAENPRPADPRAARAQDLAWALLNSPAFLFNH